MHQRRLTSHAAAKQMLRKAGYPQDLLDKVLRDLPDPIDSDRGAEALAKYGITGDALTDRMGGGP